MKKLLLLFVVVGLGFAATSCSLFKDKGDEGDDTLDPTFTFPTEVIAGKEIVVTGYIDTKYTDAGFEFRFGDTPIPHKVLETSQTVLEVPNDLNGRYKVSFVSAGRTVSLQEVSVFTLSTPIMPGTAFRVDLSNAKTIFCTQMETREPHARDLYLYTTQKFDEGKQPVDVLFYNAKGGQVPASFTAIKDLSPDFFYALMINARNNESLDFNYDDYTCKVVFNSSDSQPVVVEKKSGIITVLMKQEGDPNVFNSDMSFQQMAPRVFCFSSESYGAEFTFNKLYSFEIDEYPNDVINWAMGNDIPDFQFATTIKILPQQDNLDIINARESHWLAIGTGKVLYNKERMLSYGSLSSVNIPKDRYTMLFGCRISADFYYFDYTYDGGMPFRVINTASGGRLHTEPNCNCQYDVYQFRDSTYLRARAEKVGDKLHSYSIKPEGKEGYKLHRYETTVTAAEQYGDIFNDAFPRYPSSSNYEYYTSDSGQEVFRRRISEYNTEKSLFKAGGNAFLRLASASENAVSLMFFDISTTPEKSLIVEINANGNSVQTIDMTLGARVMGLCRLKD